MKEIRENNLKKEKNTTKGITLIALVITIVVLIILAGVAINLTLSQNGIFNKAKQARDNYKKAEANEQAALNETADYIEGIGSDGGIKNPTKEKSEIEKNRESGTYMSKTTTLKDDDGNLIKIPQGFKVAEDSGKSVTEGIIIEDKDIKEGVGKNRGNQYVWIPVGNSIKKNDGTSVNITLGRYSFADGVNDKDVDETTVLTKGTPILKQSAENYTQEVLINSCYKELTTARTGTVNSSDRKKDTNTTALDLKGFIDSVRNNGGYYIARYEATYGTDGKANSKVSDNYIDANGTAPTTEGTLWNNIHQIGAAVASRNLYENVTTDLPNSYAWNTAITYIQAFSGNTKYSYQTSKNQSLSNTGKNTDEVCKINDMSSNAAEWITETSSYTNTTSARPATYTGGCFSSSDDNTGCRASLSSTIISKDIMFRTILYM